MTVRLCKVALVAALALFFTIVACDNIIDYGSNWQFVQHVLAMDTVFPHSTLRWRAITDLRLQTLAYGLIIASEIAAAGLLWAGAGRLLAAVRGAGFDRAKGTAVIGVTMGLLLYMVGFVEIGGEWFTMWQSHVWNAQQTAFDFIFMGGIVLIVLLVPDPAR